MGVRRVAVGTAYIDEVNRRLHQFLTDSDFEVLVLEGLGARGLWRPQPGHGSGRTGPRRARVRGGAGGRWNPHLLRRPADPRPDAAPRRRLRRARGVEPARGALVRRATGGPQRPRAGYGRLLALDTPAPVAS